MRAVLRWTRLHLHVRRIRACFTLGQRECAELLASYQFRKPFLLLLVCSKEQQRPDTDRVVRVYENRCRRATASDFLEHSAVDHLRKTASAVFHRRSCAEHADASKAINHLARNVRLSIYFRRIEMVIQELPEFCERLIQLRLLRCGNARIRHHPVGNEIAFEKTFGETEGLRSGENQLLRLLNFLLPLRFDFVHRCTKVEIERNASCIPDSFRIQCKRRTRLPGSPYRYRRRSM